MLEPPNNQYYFSLANISINSKVQNKESDNIVILSIHNVPTENNCRLMSETILFRNAILWDFFSEDYKEDLETDWYTIYNNEVSLLNLDKGFMKARKFIRLKLGIHIGGFIPFKTVSFKSREFVDWLHKNKRQYVTDVLAYKWRLWRRKGNTIFKLELEEYGYILRFEYFSSNTEGVFQIEQNANVLNGRVKKMKTTTLDKIFVRIDENNFKELEIFIRSFGER